MAKLGMAIEHPLLRIFLPPNPPPSPLPPSYLIALFYTNERVCVCTCVCEREREREREKEREGVYV